MADNPRFDRMTRKLVVSAEDQAALADEYDRMTAADVPQPDTGAREVYRAVLDSLNQLGVFLAGPPAPDAQVRAWHLYSGVEYGGIYCAEPGCGCEAENSEITSGAWGHEGEDGYLTFTLADIHQLVGEHIAQRAAIREEETNG